MLLPFAATLPHCANPSVRTYPDALISLPVRRFFCKRVGSPKCVSVDATTTTGARLVGAHLLDRMPNQIFIVESGPLQTTGAA